ncbi:hypothetical protein [Bifidobacterium stellenboschense]|uniref:Uncharacterized protein n=1 Tax=Bifidobacterium stellenboschense TaxID=762211 RepID=A0A087DKT6_9BIFI|nr:hypothetical protein [Bifidobacterium stellenboschense]KFI96136.1 hypothetical protein BSTEL_1169 [Bifidobacterium stellenboschense]
MASVLQGFEEVRLVKPVGKITMTVTANAVRFNKATAQVLGFPAYVKVLVNEKTRQVAIVPTTAKADNAVKFSKPEGKQTTSVSVKDSAPLAAVSAFFELPEAPEGEVAYQQVTGSFYADDKAAVFDAASAVAGTMKRRGRKKAA